jgi:hypothetical protein
MNAPAGPGWYPDPRKPTQDRYWDGEQWTSQTRNPQSGGPIGVIRKLPMWAKIVIPIAVLLVVVAAISSDEESGDSGSSASGEKSVASAQQSESKGHSDSGGSVEGNPAENASDDNTPSVGPNGSVEVDTLRWHLRDATKTGTIGDQRYGLGEEANGVFVVTELSVTNNKSESVTLTSDTVSLVAGDSTYEADTNAESALIADGEKTFFLEDIGPGITATGSVAFDVPPSILRQSPQLRFNELGFGDTHGYIALPPLQG